MYEAIVRLSLIIVLATASAHVSASDTIDSAVMTRLCQHVKQRKILLVDTTQPETIWSDGAMFELARTFPRELQELIATPTATRDLRLILKRMSGAAEDGWREAKISRPSRGEEHATVQSSDGELKLRVARPYFDYLHERYPRAQVRIKGPLDPVLFFVDDTLRGAVMPVASGSGTKAKPEE